MIGWYYKICESQTFKNINHRIMNMPGLMTASGLIDKLSDEMTEFIDRHKKIMSMKIAAAKIADIRRWHMDGSFILSEPEQQLIKALIDEHIPREIADFEDHQRNIGQIERLISILRKSAARFAPEDEDYRKIARTGVKFLKIYKDVISQESFLVGFRHDVTYFLRKQIACLKKRDIRGFKKMLQRETLLFQGLIPLLVKEDDAILEEISLFRNRTVNKEKALYYPAVILIFAGFITMMYVEVLNKTSLSLDDAKKGFYVKLEKNTIELDSLLKKYVQDDLMRETSLEKEFQDRFGVEVIGEYRDRELKLLLSEHQTVMALTSGQGVKKWGLKQVIFVNHPIGQGGCAGYSSLNKMGFRVAGLASSSGKLLIRSSTLDDSKLSDIDYINKNKLVDTYLKDQEIRRNHPEVFYHELSHHIHFWLKMTDPDFEKEWKSAGNGFIDSYQLKNDYEDVAVLASRLINAAKLAQSKIRLIAPDIFRGKSSIVLTKIDILLKHNFFGELAPDVKQIRANWAEDWAKLAQ
jgi:hypothetical protein